MKAGYQSGTQVHVLVAFAISLLGLIGCDLYEGGVDMTPKSEVDFAKKYLTHFRERDFQNVDKHFNPDTRPRNWPEIYAQMTRLVPQEDPIRIDLVGLNVTYENGVPIGWTTLNFQYQFSNLWLVYEITLERKQGTFRVHGVHFTLNHDSLENINKFSFIGKGPTHALFLVAAIASFVVSWVALVLCLRTRIDRRKWLWCLFVFVGCAEFSLDWTTGEIFHQLLHVKIAPLGSLYTKASQYAPVVISTVIPIGAIIFLIKRREFLRGTMGVPR